MFNTDLRNIINNIKSATSCVHFLKYIAAINISHAGQTIHTPAFIRPGDNHPSFQVFDNICIDYATGNSYDIIALTQALYNMNFSEALTYLNGGENPFAQLDPKSTAKAQHLEQTYREFDNLIEQWHNNLLSDPLHNIVTTCLTDRKITMDFIKKFKLGYDPIGKRVIFPYFLPNSYAFRLVKNGAEKELYGSSITTIPEGHYVFWNGRDTTGNCKLDKNDPGFTPKYKKCALADAPTNENPLWGLQTLRPHTKAKQTCTAKDGQTYQTDEYNPQDDTLCVLEGMFDAASFAQENWQVLSPGGGFISSYQMPLFLDICRMYKKVFVCFDNDEAGANFQKKICGELLKHGIDFICGHVPASACFAADGQVTFLNYEPANKEAFSEIRPIKDVSDYYCAGGDLALLVKKAVPGLVELSRDCENLDDLEDLFKKASRHYSKTKLYQMKSACANFTDEDGVPRFSKKAVNFSFMQACTPLPEKDVAALVDQAHTILYDVSGSFYEYSHGIWEQVADVIIEKYAGEALNMFATSGRMAAVAKYLKIFHAGKFDFNRKPVFVFKNGTLDLNEKDPGRRFRASSPDDMCTSKVPYSYIPDAKCTKWLEFVAQSMGNDTKKMRLLQQMAGYVLFADNRLQKFFYLYGDGRNGKSTYLNILKAVYGSEKASSVPFSRLGTQFDPMALKDAWMNFCYEARSVLNDGEDVLKAIVSGDPIMAAHKGVDAVTFTTRAKLFVAANKLFTTGDVSLGLLRRVVFMKFDNVVSKGNENKNLYSELLGELPGIFNWCYEGYLMLMESGEFEETIQHFEAMEEFLDQMAPSMIFAREKLLDAEGEVSERNLYDLAKVWAEEGNFKLTNRAKFISDIRQILRQLRPEVRVYKRPGERTLTFKFSAVRPAKTQEGEVDHNEAIILPPSQNIQTEEKQDLTEAEGADDKVSAQAGDAGRDENTESLSDGIAGRVQDKLNMLEGLNGNTGAEITPSNENKAGRCTTVTSNEAAPVEDRNIDDQAPGHSEYDESSQTGGVRLFEAEKIELSPNDPDYVPKPADYDEPASRFNVEHYMRRPLIEVKRPVPYDEEAIADRVKHMNHPSFKSWRETLGEHFVTHSEWEQLAFYLYEHPSVKQEYYPDFDEQYAAWLEAHKDDPRDLGFSKL